MTLDVEYVIHLDGHHLPQQSTNPRVTARSPNAVPQESAVGDPSVGDPSVGTLTNTAPQSASLLTQSHLENP